MTSVNQPNLTTARGAALYIGAILGPGLLLLPGLAAAEAGPASILAWLGLLGLSGLFAAVFSALGRHVPSAGGVMGYVTAGLGPRAGRATGWMFLAGVVGGAPIVCLIGASYVTELTGGGQLARAAVAAGLLLTVIGLAAAGLRASASAQLVLVSLLTVRGGRGGGRVGDGGAGGQLDAVRAARLALGRQGGGHADVLVRRLGGRRPADHALCGPGAAAAARGGHRPGRHHRAVPGPGGGHDQRAGAAGGHGRSAGGTAAVMASARQARTWPRWPRSC